jgi:hypothetical protein
LARGVQSAQTILIYRTLTDNLSFQAHLVNSAPNIGIPIYLAQGLQIGTDKIHPVKYKTKAKSGSEARAEQHESMDDFVLSDTTDMSPTLPQEGQARSCHSQDNCGKTRNCGSKTKWAEFSRDLVSYRSLWDCSKLPQPTVDG